MTVRSVLFWSGLLIAAAGVPDREVPLLVAGFGMVAVAVVIALLGFVREVARWWRYDWRDDAPATVDSIRDQARDVELEYPLDEEQ
ncbi:hypothetical protein DN069_29990 [Streptacidiphilus pinicola]|uniref:Uncharacterized protein n=1 Tax=Streptacidiphilus pinicola TaxID=2219663 RepID=A0A2X0IAI2_9ACTN|nr:hypothetical protein [Streptacidiphilus pinicola]RAG81954.1 hypothetical protein DN069_29990 [Streptacidiphilus pinicola]